MIPIAGQAAQFVPIESVILDLNVFGRSRRTPFPRSVEASMGDMFPKEATARLALNRCRTTRRWSDKTISAQREVRHQMLTPHETPHRLHYLESSMGDQHRGRSSDFSWVVHCSCGLPQPHFDFLDSQRHWSIVSAA
jgi:hypothetical protein